MKYYFPLSYRLYQCLSKQVSALEAKQDFCALETAFEKYFKIVFQYDSLPNRIISSMSGFQVLDVQELLSACDEVPNLGPEVPNFTLITRCQGEVPNSKSWIASTVIVDK